MQTSLEKMLITGLFLLVSPWSWAQARKVPPTALAEELMTIELQARPGEVPPAAPELLRQVLADAVSAAAVTAKKHPPKTRANALVILRAIHEVLIEHRFEQPPSKNDWPDTMGQALKPRTLEPLLYYVDCDMAAQFFISVGQRLGWDIRLVEANETHLFVRWHLRSGETVSWDWTHNGSMDDAYYRITSAHETDRARATYLRSFTLDVARAYYVALIASKTSDAETAERLFLEAQPLQREDARFLNNLGWFYATHPGVTQEKRRLAVPYALAGWSYRPDNANNIDTAACAFGAKGQRDLAVMLERKAVLMNSDNAALKANLERLLKGELCAR